MAVLSLWPACSTVGRASGTIMKTTSLSQRKHFLFTCERGWDQTQQTSTGHPYLDLGDFNPDVVQKTNKTQWNAGPGGETPCRRERSKVRLVWADQKTTLYDRGELKSMSGRTAEADELQQQTLPLLSAQEQESGPFSDLPLSGIYSIHNVSPGHHTHTHTHLCNTLHLPELGGNRRTRGERTKLRTDRNPSSG